MIELYGDFCAPKLITELDINDLDLIEVKEPLEWLTNLTKEYDDQLNFGIFCLFFGINKKKTKAKGPCNTKEIAKLYANQNLQPKMLDRAVKKFLYILKLLIVLNRTYPKERASEMSDLVLAWIQRMQKKEHFIAFCQSNNLEVLVGKSGSPIFHHNVLAYIKKYYLSEIEG